MSLQDIFGLIGSEIVYTLLFLLSLVSWVWTEPFFIVVLPTFAFIFILYFITDLIVKLFLKIKINDARVNIGIWIMVFIGLLLTYDYFSLSIYYYDFSVSDIFKAIGSIPLIRHIPF